MISMAIYIFMSLWLYHSDIPYMVFPSYTIGTVDGRNPAPVENGGLSHDL